MIAVPPSHDQPTRQARLGRVLSGNPTGAGDAAVAAIASAFGAGQTDPTLVLSRATAWSAAAVLMPGAGQIHPSHTSLENDVQIAVY
jgi:fructose-1-phosphate kinase PfkB-like protein